MLLDGTDFSGGTFVLRVTNGANRVTLRDNEFTGQRETAISFTGAGTGPVTVERATIRQTVDAGHGYSPISGSCSGCRMNGITIRDSLIDQGTSAIGWFGIEVWDTDGLVIEGNTLRGGRTLVSIPRSDRAIVRGNSFDMSIPYWGVELADVEDATVTGNTVFGASSCQHDGCAFVQLHPGSGAVLRNTITFNRVSDRWALVNAAGSGHVITDNCGGWVKLYAYSFSGPVTIARNGPCS